MPCSPRPWARRCTRPGLSTQLAIFVAVAIGMAKPSPADLVLEAGRGRGVDADHLAGGGQQQAAGVAGPPPRLPRRMVGELVMQTTRRAAPSCGARIPDPGYAACAYSLIRPPRIGRRFTRVKAGSGERGGGGFGGCWPSVRCGR
jgi:hypothetical protein